MGCLRVLGAHSRHAATKVPIALCRLIISPALFPYYDTAERKTAAKACRNPLRHFRLSSFYFTPFHNSTALKLRGHENNYAPNQTLKTFFHQESNIQFHLPNTQPSNYLPQIQILTRSLPLNKNSSCSSCIYITVFSLPRPSLKLLSNGIGTYFFNLVSQGC